MATAAISTSVSGFENPPRLMCSDGEPRHVGLEFEFIGLTASAAADLVRQRYGGKVHTLGEYDSRIVDGRLGDMRVKLDTRFAPKADGPKETNGALESFLEEIDKGARSLFAGLAEGVVPLEITTSPVIIDRLPEFGQLLEGLRELGAEGTEESPLYAFGTHFNPEVASCEPDYLLSVLRSYVLLEDSLRASMRPDLTRRILPFVASFPDRYVRKVADPSYRPDLHSLIADYASDNPTRNRSLDMLTPFAWCDRELVDALVPNAHVGARPTFHYRLPDLRLDDRCWSLAQEWNRWVMVERVAEDAPLLERLGAAYLSHDPVRDGEWAKVAARLITE